MPNRQAHAFLMGRRARMRQSIVLLSKRGRSKCLCALRKCLQMMFASKSDYAYRHVLYEGHRLRFANSLGGRHRAISYQSVPILSVSFQILLMLSLI
jgi:hypothetical protein